jgi:hypothetical protein
MTPSTLSKGWRIGQKIRTWLNKSDHFHLRRNGVVDLESFIDLVDRFIDGDVRYPLEWDDFISWKNADANVEKARDRIASAEPLFFSKNERDRREALTILLEERNEAARFVGMPSRVHHRHRANEFRIKIGRSGLGS